MHSRYAAVGAHGFDTNAGPLPPSDATQYAQPCTDVTHTTHSSVSPKHASSSPQKHARCAAVAAARATAVAHSTAVTLARNTLSHISWGGRAAVIASMDCRHTFGPCSNNVTLSGDDDVAVVLVWCVLMLLFAAALLVMCRANRRTARAHELLVHAADVAYVADNDDT